MMESDRDVSSDGSETQYTHTAAIDLGYGDFPGVDTVLSIALSCNDAACPTEDQSEGVLGHCRIERSSRIGHDDVAVYHLIIEHGFKPDPDALYSFQLPREKEWHPWQTTEYNIGINNPGGEFFIGSRGNGLDIW
jgi:hypothetical protein